MTLVQMLRTVNGNGRNHSKPLGRVAGGQPQPPAGHAEQPERQLLHRRPVQLNLVFINAKAAATAQQLAPAVPVGLRAVPRPAARRVDPPVPPRPGPDRTHPRRPVCPAPGGHLRFGGVTLRTLINAITDSAGRPLTVTSSIWDNVSERNAAADVAVATGASSATEVLAGITERIAEHRRLGVVPGRHGRERHQRTAGGDRRDRPVLDRGAGPGPRRGRGHRGGRRQAARPAAVLHRDRRLPAADHRGGRADQDARAERDDRGRPGRARRARASPSSPTR